MNTHFDMLPIGAFEQKAFAVGGRRLYGGKGGSAPAPDPAIGQAARENAVLGKEQLDWYRSIYQSDLKPRQEKMDALTDKVVSQQLGIADANEKRASEQWQHYATTFQPIEKQMAEEAKSYDSAEAQDRAAGDAGSAVARNMGLARDANQRAMARMGVNPASGRYASTMQQQGNMEALARAGAETGARSSLRDKGIALRAGAANFGRNMPNTAAQAYGLSMAGGQGAQGALGNANNMAVQNAGVMGQGFNAAMQGNQSMAGILNQQYGQQVNAWGQQQQANASNNAAIGQVIGTAGAMAF